VSRVWVTRAEPGASATASRLSARGYDPLVAPLLDIRFAESLAEDPAAFQAVLFTSANAVRAVARLTDARARALCVGAATADAARAAGFEPVESAEGDAAALVALAKTRLERGDGPLLFASGAQVARRIDRALSGAGFETTRAVVYESREAPALPEPAREALESGRLGAALVHSPRAAMTLARLVPRDAAGGLRCAAISAAAAKPLSGPVEVAETPDEPALLDALARLLPPPR